MNAGGRFRFSLETVLKVKNLREDQARLELSRAYSQLVRCRQALADTEAHISETLSHLNDSRNWRASEYQMAFSYLEHLKLAREGWQERVAQEEKVVQEKTRVLEKCHQERRLLENLRGKKYLEFRRELTKFLESQNEAIVLARWSRP
jgi:flagellar FliJ protein|uniref:Flagellar FliJ protein n=1 Tax=Desulfobacca acetoxidans TaxID=60893 RepID=A0A7V6A2V2_9BACT